MALVAAGDAMRARMWDPESMLRAPLQEDGLQMEGEATELLKVLTGAEVVETPFERAMTPAGLSVQGLLSKVVKPGTESLRQTL